MSGIAALLQFDGRPAPMELLGSMGETAAALGPHGFDSWHAGSVGLGHCHFWTTAEEQEERQPIGDSATRYCLTADLRLTNRDELLGRLRQRTMSLPHSASDAQLLLACYSVWKTDTFRLLQGGFALAIWDGPEQRLVCARDPLGLRPLFYHCNCDRFLCGSLIRQLHCDGATSRRLSKSWIGDYLVARRTASRSTVFNDIYRLAPGHWLQVRSDGKLRLSRYWDPAAIQLARSRDADWYAGEFRHRFFAAVRACLRSPSTKVGFHVSGGVDSTAVLAVAHELDRKENLSLEPVAFVNLARHPAADERRFIRDVLARYRMPVQTTRAEQFWAWRTDPIVRHWQDEPCEAPYAARLVAELQQAHTLGVKAILSGTGGDEIGGSSWYLFDLLLRGKILKFWPELRRRACGKHVSPAHLLKMLLVHLARWSYQAVCPQVPRLPEWIDRGFARRAGLCRRSRQRPAYRNPARDSVYEQLRLCWSEPLLSAWQPVFGHFGVEMHHPFLDQRLFEWALSVPPFHFGHEGRVKGPLRTGLSDLLPDSIRKRPDKGNYLHYWDLGLRCKERPTILRLLEGPITAELGLVDPRKLQAAYEEYCRRGKIHRAQFWNWLTLEDWLRRTFRAPDAPAL